MALPLSAEPPVFLIVGGPNGSGKSSAYTDTVAELENRTIWIVNPDLLTVRIRDAERMSLEDANLVAVQRLETWLEASIDVHKSIGVETVLSTDKFRRLVVKAKQLGFEFWLVYVILASPELNVERVRIRVLKGGHDVPKEAIQRRFWKSLYQLPWFLNEADRATLYDNSGKQSRRVGTKRNGIVTLDPSAPRVLVEALSA